MNAPAPTPPRRPRLTLPRLLRALALAQADWSREVPEPERLDSVHRHFETMLDDLAELAEAAPAAAPDAAQPAGRLSARGWCARRGRCAG